MANNNDASVGKKKTFTKVLKVKVDIRSGIMMDLMRKNADWVLEKFQRFGGLRHMLARDPLLTEMINLWQATNMKIGYVLIEDLEQRYEAIELAVEPEIPVIEVPDDWFWDVEARFPIVHDYVKLVRKLDAAMDRLEGLHLAGAVDESEVLKGKHAAIQILTGVGQRMAKATLPGKRSENNRYSARTMNDFIREGWRLEILDFPFELREMVEEYEAKTAAFKSKKNELEASAEIPSSDEVLVEGENTSGEEVEVSSDGDAAQEKDLDVEDDSALEPELVIEESSDDETAGDPVDEVVGDSVGEGAELEIEGIEKTNIGGDSLEEASMAEQSVDSEE